MDLCEDDDDEKGENQINCNDRDGGHKDKFNLGLKVIKIVEGDEKWSY